MALKVWEDYLRNAGLQEEHASIYADKLVKNDMLPESATELDRNILADLGITSILNSKGEVRQQD